MTLKSIQLDRVFLELKGESDDVAIDADIASLAAFNLEKAHSWDQLLNRRCVVVLGEAGTGKTTEFRQRCEILVASTGAAFFLTVEELASEGLAGSLGSGPRTRLAAWTESNERGYFFLDAVDEARLNGKRFTTALRKLEQEIGAALSRATILISCRVSDWRAYSDRDEILSSLYPANLERESTSTSSAEAPTTEEIEHIIDGFNNSDPDDNSWRTRREASKEPGLRILDRNPFLVSVYALAPLNEKQVQLLASSLGVAEPQAFTQAAKKAAAYAYLERPRDVEWLVGYWLRHDSIGSLTELIENDVREKLIERNPDRRSSLSAARARGAAEVLAGISALEQQTAFLLPDGDLDATRVAKCVDPSIWLPDLTKQELSELLTLAVFDEATYGRVRLHHRTVAEYLAAQWLSSLVQKGLALVEVEAVIFRRGADGLVVPKELVAIAAWLAGMSEHIRRRLLEVAPLVLLEGGDPNNLPESCRHDLLNALAQQYATRSRLFRSFDQATLGRFASGNLAHTINTLLRTSTQDELLATLLTIVGEGVMVGCAEETLKLALEDTTPRHARLEAISAIAKVGDRCHWELLLRTIIDESLEVDHEVGGALVSAMHPHAMNATRLLVLLSRVRPPPKQTGTLLPYLVGNRVYRDAPAADRGALLQGLLNLVRLPDELHGARHSWLIAPMAEFASRYAIEHAVDELIVLLIRFFAELEGAAKFGSEYGMDEIRKLIAGRIDLRRLMFWEHVSVVKATSRRIPTRFVHLHVVERLWDFCDEDREWLEADARTRSAVQDRLLAFDCLLTAPMANVQIHCRDAQISQLVETDRIIAKRYKRHCLAATSHVETQWQRRHRIREARRKREYEDDLRWLHDHISKIESGEDERALTLLASIAHLDPQEPELGIAKLQERYNERIATAARWGWCRMWRRSICPLPHEEEKRNTYSFSMIAGFAGLSIDVENGLDFSTLTNGEALQAARYATRSMNRFPVWVIDLATKQPGAIAKIFSESIRADYAVPPDGPQILNVLGLLSHAGPVVRQLCASTVVELLQLGDPPRLDTLEQCIEAMIATASTHVDMGRIATARCAALNPSHHGDASSNRRQFILWWCTWLCLDASNAISELESTIAHDPPAANALVLDVCDRLWRFYEDVYIGFAFPSSGTLLVRLVSIIFLHIRPEDDRGSEAHLFDARDHAELLRRYLLDKLIAAAGDDAYLGLRHLAGNPALSIWRDYLLARAEQRLAQDAGAKDASVAERLVRAYKQHGLSAPVHFAEVGLRTMAVANVDFGIITALPEERDAVLAQLRQVTTVEKLDKDGDDTHTYYQATLQTTRKDHAVYRVVLVCCPSMGPQIAVATTGALLTRWKPRHVILVGIALGLEGETQHGDVMLASQVGDYSLGKKETGNEREIRWTAHPAGASLFESAQALDPEWSRTILVTRPGTGTPRLCVGTVASGGDVVADDDLITKFQKQWPKLIGIEMEAGGTATAVHDNVNRPEFLMIKGVSDHGKDKRESSTLSWRAYACSSAAAFAVELMRAGPAPALSSGQTASV